MAKYIITEKAGRFVAGHGNTGVGTSLELHPLAAEYELRLGTLVEAPAEAPAAAPAEAPVEQPMVEAQTPDEPMPAEPAPAESTEPAAAKSSHRKPRK